ncbi:MAG: hypothetical protein CM15mP49_29700 [Actinomycetota bacterium]|nr:MAG: hypothetical protein CM15mP49_29700 [Actinomycetota bacterium]
MKIKRHKPLTLVREMVEVLRLLFSGETVRFSGEKLSLGPAQINYGGKEIDIFLAGRGPKMLELGAQKADGFYLSYIYKNTLQTLSLSFAHRTGQIVKDSILCTQQC